MEKFSINKVIAQEKRCWLEEQSNKSEGFVFFYKHTKKPINSKKIALDDLS